MNNSAKCFYIILCLIFVIVILLTITKDIIMDNNEKKIQEDFHGGSGGGGRGAGGFSGGRGGNFGGGMGANMGMDIGRSKGTNFTQGNVGMRRASMAGATALGGNHIYNNHNNQWNHRNNYYRPFFYGSVPMWYWNNGSYNNDGRSYYDSYPDTVNYNFYDIREGDENNYS
jgi:hypothetical protein